MALFASVVGAFFAIPQFTTLEPSEEASCAFQFQTAWHMRQVPKRKYGKVIPFTCKYLHRNGWLDLKK